MNKAAKNDRDELAWKYLGNYSLTTESGQTRFNNFQSGFDAGYAYQEERLKIAIEALEKITMLLAYAGKITPDIQEYLIKQFSVKAPEISKEALAKIRGEK